MIGCNPIWMRGWGLHKYAGGRWSWEDPSFPCWQWKIPRCSLHVSWIFHCQAKAQQQLRELHTRGVTRMEITEETEQDSEAAFHEVSPLAKNAGIRAASKKPVGWLL